MDEPPEQLYNQWIRDRMEFYKRSQRSLPGMSLHSLVVGHLEQPGEVGVGGNPLGGEGGDPEGRFCLTTLSDVGVVGGKGFSLLGTVFTTVSSLIPFWWRTWVLLVAWQWSHVTAA